MKDYTDKICGCWKVKERDFHPKSKSHETFWIAECLNCGNIASVRKSDLDKEPKSCNKCKGWDLRSWKIGDKYGLLTIIGEAPNKGNHTYVTVQCDCGSEPFQVRLEHLKGQSHSKTVSCGCLTKSAGELKIKTILEENKINFQQEYRIITEDEHPMYFDFVILDNNNQIIKAIEFDGEQHFKPIEFFGGEETFLKQQERDARKTDYCARHGIFLQRIPYTDYDKINLEMLLEGLDNSFLENEKIFGESLDEQKPICENSDKKS